MAKLKLLQSPFQIWIEVGCLFLTDLVPYVDGVDNFIEFASANSGDVQPPTPHLVVTRYGFRFSKYTYIASNIQLTAYKALNLQPVKAHQMQIFKVSWHCSLPLLRCIRSKCQDEGFTKLEHEKKSLLLQKQEDEDRDWTKRKLDQVLRVCNLI
ncbi:hypothetical protein RHMOL_Rhmol02G0091600 [Rhododendron molle]|uniref:Uncharacterized protein n=2 Tax=Rhododendron molle TaxID=49168 RepID=A0ACC0PQS3_RHOML|nr:hypothetical protein RHMOL_Rhmol02G0091600 [Rhododendron molle]KAI8567058.1 hypothetical protein RHMOL_Rhmol02G0091600 [Rhododendron molle]